MTTVTVASEGSLSSTPLPASTEHCTFSVIPPSTNSCLEYEVHCRCPGHPPIPQLPGKPGKPGKQFSSFDVEKAQILPHREGVQKFLDGVTNVHLFPTSHHFQAGSSLNASYCCTQPEGPTPQVRCINITPLLGARALHERLDFSVPSCLWTPLVLISGTVQLAVNFAFLMIFVISLK